MSSSGAVREDVALGSDVEVDPVPAGRAGPHLRDRPGLQRERDVVGERDGAVARPERERPEADGAVDRLGVGPARGRQRVRDPREPLDLRRRLDDRARRHVARRAAAGDVRGAHGVAPDRRLAAVLAVAEDDRRAAVLVELDVVVGGIRVGGDDAAVVGDVVQEVRAPRCHVDRARAGVDGDDERVEHDRARRERERLVRLARRRAERSRSSTWRPCRTGRPANESLPSAPAVDLGPGEVDRAIVAQVDERSAPGSRRRWSRTRRRPGTTTVVGSPGPGGLKTSVSSALAGDGRSKLVADQPQQVDDAAALDRGVEERLARDPVLVVARRCRPCRRTGRRAASRGRPRERSVHSGSR